MRIQLILALVALAGISQAQVVWTDNFDSYPVGSLSGQGGWTVNNPPTNIVEGGGGRPVADTLSQMVLQQPATGGSFAIHGVGEWGNRNPGNNILVLSGAIYVTSGTTNLGSAIMQVVGFAGGAERMGYAGIANGRFVYGTGNDLFNGPTVALSQWNYVRIEVDLLGNSSKMFGNGSLLGSGTFTSGLVLNNWGFQTIALGGPVSNPVYFDSMQVEAVPEPMTLLALSFGCMGIMRRRRC